MKALGYLPGHQRIQGGDAGQWKVHSDSGTKLMGKENTCIVLL